MMIAIELPTEIKSRPDVLAKATGTTTGLYARVKCRRILDNMDVRISPSEFVAVMKRLFFWSK